MTKQETEAAIYCARLLENATRVTTEPGVPARDVTLRVLVTEAAAKGDADEVLRLTANHLGVNLDTSEGRQKATEKALEFDPTLVLSPERREAYLLRQNHRRIEADLSKLQRDKLIARQELQAERERMAGFESAMAWTHAKAMAGFTENPNPSTMSHDEVRRHRAALEYYRDAVAPQLKRLFGDEK